MKLLPKFWPLDLDPEDELYESIAWDLPGFTGRKRRKPRRQTADYPPTQLAGR